MSRQVVAAEDPLEGEADLLRYFRDGARPRDRWGVGLEYERIGVFAASGETVPYEGPASVAEVLRRMAAAARWIPGGEGNHILELTREGAAVSLEPGAQLEFSGSVHRGLHPLRHELTAFLDDVESVSAPLGIAWLAIGLNPFTPVERVGWIPKGRYRVMSDRLGRRGRLAHHMMKVTAGIQGNFDFADEADAMEKLRLAMAATSVSTAMLANSPLYAGVPNRLLSMRGFIWLDTDPDRCGLLPLAFHPEEGFRGYLDYALAVPMLFMVRDGQWIDMEGYTFRRFLAEGRNGWRATLADWALHLTTLFPEVRLKQYVEVRGADSVQEDLAVALMAWWKGLLYDDRSRQDAWRELRDLNWPERQQFHRDILSQGLAATVRRRSARELASALTAIAAEGLRRQPGPGGADESAFLAPLEALVADASRVPAAQLLHQWDGDWKGDRLRLVEHARRRTSHPSAGHPGGAPSDPLAS